MRMQYFRKPFSIRGVLTLILVLSIIENSRGQDKPGDFQHELPPGVELVNPKDFGLTDADLGKFLGNVKVLGGGQVGDTKTQILTVGFDGDEDLNFDDFEIPGLTDKKSKENSSSSPVPDKDKEIANIAFEKFKEFFKDPSKNAKIYDAATQRSLPTPYATISPQAISNASPFFPSQNTQSLIGTSTASYKKIENERPVYKQTLKDHGPKFNNVLRQNSQSLQQHYPVTLTQPIVSSSTPRNPNTSNANRAVVSIQHHKPRPSTPPNYSNHHHSHESSINSNEVHRGQKEYSPIEHREIAENYITPGLPTQNQLHGQQQRFPSSDSKQNNLFSSQGDFGTKLLSSVESTTYRTILQQALQQQGFSSTPQYTNDNVGPTFQGQVIRKPYRTEPQYVSRIQSASPSSLPSANFQNFNLHNSQAPGIQQHQHQQHSQKEQSQSLGKIVRNQLTFNYPTENTLSAYTPRAAPPSPSPSASVASPVLQKFHHSLPQQSQQDQRPVSHVYINHNSHSSPVQQTSFHPRFQPPTRFVNDFTPSANRPTTPAPRFDVTPSVPMILISTNENAIKDPERMARLRQQQRHREEIRQREEQRQQELQLREEARQAELQQQQYEAEQQQQRQPHALNFQPQQSSQNPQYQQGPPPPPPQQQHQQFQPNIPVPQPHQQLQHQQPSQRENYITNGPPIPPQQFQNHQHQIPATQPPARQFQGQNTHQPKPTQQYSTIHKLPHPVPDFQPTPQQPQNSFNFQAQAQQHQLHTLQPPPQPSRYSDQFQFPSYSTIFPQPQASNNYPQLQQAGGGLSVSGGGGGGSFAPRFPTRDNQYTYSTIRHKRGYRHRLSSLLRGLWRGGEREQS